MSLEALVTISEQAKSISDVLTAWATPRGGTVEVMANMAHLWEKIYKVKSDKPLILIAWNGEISRGGFREANTLHRVDRAWLIVIMRGHGFIQDVSQKGPTAGADPLWDYLELIREELRKIENISEEFPIDYKSAKPMPNPAPSPSANIFMDADIIEFSTANDLPAVSRNLETS